MTQMKRMAGPVLVALVLCAVGAQQASVGRTHRSGALVAVAVMVLIISVLVERPPVRWLLPGVAPVLVAAGFGILLLPDAAVLPAAIGVLLLVLMAAGVDVARPIEAGIDAVGRGLTIAAGFVAFLIIVIPGWAWTKARRRDPLSASSAGWAAREGTRASPSSLASSPEVQGTRRTLAGRLTWAFGCVMLLLTLNFGAGLAWDRAHPDDEPAAATGPQKRTGSVQRDPRNDVPTMAAYPWRQQYFEDLQRTTGGYWPFTEFRPADFSSPYINITDWARKTYTPKGDRATMPTAWMFGGSTTFGEGQRDERTIASWVARLAEADGLPLIVRNYGQRGWTHFQEMILYEQQLAAKTPPDLAIFYDGANEINSQAFLREPVPTHTLTYQYARALAGTNVATQFLQNDPSPFGLRDALDLYREHSAIHKLAAYLKGDPAGASPNEQADGVDPAITNGSERAPNGGWNFDVTAQDGTDAGKVYERGKAFTLMLSQKYDVQPFLFWQPIAFKDEPQRRAEAELTDPTIDISDILVGHDDVFIDGGHTNEEGARLVAIELWKHLEPSVRAWYQENR